MDTPTHHQSPTAPAAAAIRDGLEPRDPLFWRVADQHPVALVIGCVLLTALSALGLFLLPDGQLANPI